MGTFHKRSYNDGCHGWRNREATKYLRGGWHLARLEMFERGGHAGMLFRYMGRVTGNTYRLLFGRVQEDTSLPRPPPIEDPPPPPPPHSPSLIHPSLFFVRSWSPFPISCRRFVFLRATPPSSSSSSSHYIPVFRTCCLEKISKFDKTSGSNFLRSQTSGRTM